MVAFVAVRRAGSHQIFGCAVVGCLGRAVADCIHDGFDWACRPLIMDSLFGLLALVWLCDCLCITVYSPSLGPKAWRTQSLGPCRLAGRGS